MGMRRRPKYCQESAFDFFELALKAPTPSERLLCGALGIALHFLPNQSPVVSLEAIEELASTVKRRVRHPSPEALVAQLHEVLFDEMGFRGDSHHYFEVDNSLIPRVLETKRGLPITLTLIYRAVAERVGLTVEGINSPGHFLARVHVGNDRMLVDPFHGGRLLSDSEATHMVERIVQQSRQPGEEWFPVCDEHQWLHRILNNLRSLLIHSGSSRNVAAMRELQAVLSDEGGEQ
jgi:regulator of sirC expression with transglutaminase-like and TPR domain